MTGLQRSSTKYTFQGQRNDGLVDGKEQQLVGWLLHITEGIKSKSKKSRRKNWKLWVEKMYFTGS